MNDVLINTIRIIEGIKPNLNKFSFTYLFTTENISGFTKKISFEDQNILTVCSSGDQALNMILNGAKNVDLFDINIFSKYYFHLKLAAIKSLSYEEFFNFFVPKNIFSKKGVFALNTYLKIRNEIANDEISYYWDYLFGHYSGQIIYNSGIFSNLKNDKNIYKECNDYLKNEENYNLLKEKLKNKKFNFYNLNLFDDQIPNTLKYNFVYLSNIFDYLRTNNEIEFLKILKKIILKIKPNLTQSGTIGISYVYLFFDDYDIRDNARFLKYNLIVNSNNSEFNYIDFPGFFFPTSTQKKNNDALILYKNK